jgi:hypothetical protein
MLVLLFGPTDALRTSDAVASLALHFPSAIHVGCSSGTTVNHGGLSDEKLSAVAIGFEHTQIRLSTHSLACADSSRDVGFALGRDLAGPDLAGVLVLSDGLCVNGSALVDGIVSACGPNVAVSGGLAGDGDRFASTVLVINGKPVSGAVAAIGLYGSAIRISHGSAGGWDEFGPMRRITSASGNVLAELDGKPALDLYERYLGDEAAGLPASALFYPLKVWDPARPDDAVVRTVLAVDRTTRTMTFAGDIPEGYCARLMRGSFDRLIDGAGEAALLARNGLGAAGTTAGLCLLVSCVGRRLLMGQRTEEEYDAIASVLGHATPIAGFYSYGEISPNNRTGACGLHNQTVTLTLLAEAA